MKLILPFIFLFFATICAGQQPGFNIVAETVYPQSHLEDMLIDNDTIVGYGIAFSDTVQWKQGLLLVKFDSSGNLLKSVFILDTLGDKLAMDKVWGRMIKTFDGGYAMTAATVSRKSAFLIKVNHNLDIEFIKEYPDTVNLSNYNYRLLEIQDGYFLFGSIQRPNFLNDSFIRRVDTEGNTVWFNYYGDYNVSDVMMDIKAINDSVFVAGSVEAITPDIYGAYRTAIRKINLDGDVLQTWKSQPDPDIGYLLKILPTENGEVITYGQYLISQNGTTKIVQPTLARLNANYQVQWVKHFGRKASLSVDISFWDIEPASDGNYLGVGEGVLKPPGEPSRRYGWLMKFSPEGDSIWSRHDLAPLPPEATHSHLYGGVGVLSSGSIIAGGSVIEINKHYIWLVKVTNDGCLDTLFCGLVDAGEVWPGKEGVEVRVYPNPASEYLIIESGPGVSGSFDFSLFDARGRLVLQSKIGQPGESRIDLPVLPDGLYFYKMHQQGEHVKAGKIIVSH